MNCKSAQALLSAYVDRELSGNEMSRVRKHLCECSCCDTEALELIQLKEILSAVPQAEPPAGFEERLFAAVLAPPRAAPQPTWRESWPLVAGVGLAAAAITMFFVGHADETTSAEAVRRSDDVMAREIHNDQAAMLGNDPFSGAPLVVPIAYESK